MSIISGRFNEQMKKLRTEVAVIHDTDVSRSSASLTAFQLGISNMKRRKTRTVLTFSTLLLLTFTVLSFTLHPHGPAVQSNQPRQRRTL